MNLQAVDLHSTFIEESTARFKNYILSSRGIEICQLQEGATKSKRKVEKELQIILFSDSLHMTLAPPAH